MDDDFEVEITDLRTGQALGAGPVPLVVSPPREAGRAQPAPSGGGPSRRQVVGAVVTVALVALVLTALLSGTLGSGGMPFGLFPTPVPTATLADGADTFYLTNGVPWGRLLADGKPINVTYTQQAPAFFRLPIGRHTLEYDAPPFPRLTCVASVPGAGADTCAIFTPPQSPDSSIYGAAARGLNLEATLNRLPPDELNALITATARSLTAPVGATTVPAGSRYQGASGRLTVTNEPLRAQLFYLLNTDASATGIVGLDGQKCVSLCDFSWDGGSPDSGASGFWGIGANIAPILRYTSASGASFDLPAIPALPDAPRTSMIFLRVTWQGAWQVAPDLNGGGPAGGDAGCSIAMRALGQNLAFDNGGNGDSATQALAANPANGCLLVFQIMDQSGQPAGKPLRFLYRFGLVLAANSAAHRLMPALPVAIGDEAALARQLATQLAPPWNS